MNSFLIHRQSLHRMFKVPRCPQHSKYLFWNVSQILHLLIALALSWSRTVNKYGLDSASQISCCLCHSRTQLGPSLLEIICLRKKMHIFPQLFFLPLLENEMIFFDSLWLCWPLTSSETKASKLETTERIICDPSSLLSLNDYWMTASDEMNRQSWAFVGDSFLVKVNFYFFIELHHKRNICVEFQNHI